MYCLIIYFSILWTQSTIKSALQITVGGVVNTIPKKNATYPFVKLNMNFVLCVTRKKKL